MNSKVSCKQRVACHRLPQTNVRSAPRRCAPARASTQEMPATASTSSGGSPANQLEALKAMSKVVADTGDLEKVKQYKPTDCTTNPSLVLKAVQDPAYAHYLEDAIKEEKQADDKYVVKDRPFAGVADRLIVDIGIDMLDAVPGRISTEVDANLSYDTQATLDKARRIIGLYKERGIGPERVYIKVASTWEGVQAAKQLESEGINCNCTLIFSFGQAVACAQAKASLVSPFVGRILDWFKTKYDREYEATEDPGVLAVRRVYNYYKKYGHDTIVMGASFRNKGEIEQLAGIDNITISPDLLKELEDNKQELPQMLSPEKAMSECQDEKIPNMDESMFYDLHNKDDMAVDKLKEGIEKFAQAQDDLEQMLSKIADEKNLGTPH